MLMDVRMNIISTRRILERLDRRSQERNSGVSVVGSPGARAAAWPVKIKSHSSYNTYNVRAVVVGLPGTEPSEIGGQMEAINLAESFVEEGQLSNETYVIMFRVGRKNIFYVPA